MNHNRIAAVIAGNLRRGTAEILSFFASRVEIVVLSTWDDEVLSDIVPDGVEVVVSRKPPNPGLSNRNCQRAATIAGLRRAEQLGAEHVLKWRTDMLPTKLDIAELKRWSAQGVQKGLDSRYVTCAFRNLSVAEDWFSSIPDLFGFASIGVMKLMWDDYDFDYLSDFNMPPTMSKEVGSEWVCGGQIGSVYCAESELYAIFRDRLQALLGRPLDHYTIAKDYMRLFNHNKLGVCWFGPDGDFRSITQAVEHPWWTEFQWKYLHPGTCERGYPDKGLIKLFLRTVIGPAVIEYNIARQRRWYWNYLRNKNGKRHL